MGTKETTLSFIILKKNRHRQQTSIQKKVQFLYKNRFNLCEGL